MNIIVNSDTEYVQADYVLQHAPIYSKGCRGTRDLIKKKKIKEYIFMRLSNDKWIETNGSSQKLDKVFILKTVLDTIPELNQSEIITDDNGIEKAPNIIYLEKHEKFYDNDGNTLDIETRGERNVDHIYFKVKDIMEGFGLNRLNDIITNNKFDGYVENKHYKYFMCEKSPCIIKKELFLTYIGLLRFLLNIREDRTKELNIVNNIKKYININWKCNKSLKCLYRPDMYAIIDNRLIIIEIDENQHKNYDKKEEIHRLDSIISELKCKYNTIIRINPDTYIDSNNIKHSGICDNFEEFNIRMNIIIDSINKIMLSVNNNIHYLFYDKYNYNINVNNIKFEYCINDKFEKLNVFRSKFLKWATNTLFTVQMGTTEQKDYLVSSIKGVSYENIQELFSINARELPCIYLTSLNRVDILRNEMNIDDSHEDDSIVYKYGMTKSFETRKNGHNQEYKKIDHLIDKKLVYYTYIDPLYLREAECEIKYMLEDLKLKWDTHEELVVIPNQLMKYVKECFKSIGLKYAGHNTELIKENTELKCKNEMLIKEYEKEYKHKLELKEKDTQLLLKDKDAQLILKDIELKEKDNELLKKELEIMKLKYEK